MSVAEAIEGAALAELTRLGGALDTSYHWHLIAWLCAARGAQLVQALPLIRRRSGGRLSAAYNEAARGAADCQRGVTCALALRGRVTWPKYEGACTQ